MTSTIASASDIVNGSIIIDPHRIASQFRTKINTGTLDTAVEHTAEANKAEASGITSNDQALNITLNKTILGAEDGPYDADNILLLPHWNQNNRL